MDNPLDEVGDLFGNSRWGGLRGRVGDIERARKEMPWILVPTPLKCVELANKIEKLEVAASVPERIIKSLDWLATHVGTEEVYTPEVKNKVSAVSNRLLKVLTKDSNKAEAPPRGAMF